MGRQEHKLIPLATHAIPRGKVMLRWLDAGIVEWEQSDLQNAHQCVGDHSEVALSVTGMIDPGRTWAW